MAMRRGISVAISRSSISCCALQDLPLLRRGFKAFVFLALGISRCCTPLKGPEIFEGTQALAKILDMGHVAGRKPAEQQVHL